MKTALTIQKIVILTAIILFGIDNTNAQWLNSPSVTDGIYHNGSVGIDVQDPQGSLHIAGTQWPSLLIERPVNDDYREVMTQMGISGSYPTLGLRLRMSDNSGTSWNDAFFIRSNCNIGIGTLTPNYKLQVNGIVASTTGGFRLPDGTIIDDASDLGNGISPVWSVSSENEASYSGGNVGIGLTNPNYKLDVSGIVSSTTGGFRLPDGTILDDASDLGGSSVWNVSAENEIYYTAGNVGLGTTNPDAELHIRADQPWFLMMERDGLPGHEARYGISGTDQSYGLRFQTTDGGAWNETLFLKSNGNVGIGTVTPGSYKLAVEGTIGAREVKITLDAWSDFVFEEDYQLRSLAETEAFIKTNKHLPDVPSEAEVLEEGIAVGEMNAILLQKIEELTLHLIEQEKRIAALEEENNTLKEE